MSALNTIASDTLVEAIARGIAKAKGIEICADASYRHSTFGPLAQAALTAIAEAGFVVCPIEPTEAMEEAARDVPFIAMGNGEYLEPDRIDIYRAMIAAITHCNHTNNGKAE